MRRALPLVAIAALVGPASAWSADIAMTADRTVARYNEITRFSGTVPSSEPQDVSLVRNGLVVASTVAVGGEFSFALRAREPGTFVARSAAAESTPVVLRLEPRLTSKIVGHRRLGHGVFVTGRLLPARAGRLMLGRAPVRVAADGRFRARVPSSRGSQFGGRLVLRPNTGYMPIRSQLALPTLRMGSEGPAVSALKQRLWELRYALPSVNAKFGHKTYEAVVAFQKVHRLPRTGRVGPAVWRALWRATVPTPRVRRGDYLEVDKTRQVLMEVRGGRVVRVIHVSTGLTDNTPVGTWRIYRKVVGWDWVLYHPMYFLRGFAIHGYTSVPTWPASHGCVRVPLWVASSLRERWDYGSVIRVYA